MENQINENDQSPVMNVADLRTLATRRKFSRTTMFPLKPHDTKLQQNSQKEVKKIEIADVEEVCGGMKKANDAKLENRFQNEVNKVVDDAAAFGSQGKRRKGSNLKAIVNGNDACVRAIDDDTESRDTMEVKDKFPVLSDDVVADILARSHPKSLLTFKCTCKSWYRFISDAEFQRNYTLNLESRSCDPPGIFFQKGFTCCESCDTLERVVDYLSTSPRLFVSQSQYILDFLPVTTGLVLVASSNGILCCRSIVPSRFCKKYVESYSGKSRSSSDNYSIQSSSSPTFYICNPATKEWISLRVPWGFNIEKVIGFNYDPDSLSFILVGLQLSYDEDKQGCCTFVIYESKSKQWRVSKEFDCFASGIRDGKHAVFLNGRCHCISYKSFNACVWYNLRMVIFDVREESCQVIELPHIVQSNLTHGNNRTCCLGVSQGHVHYICAYRYEVKIWKLDYNDNEPSLQKKWTWTTSALKFPSLDELFKVPWRGDSLINQPFPSLYKYFKVPWRIHSLINQPSQVLIPHYLYNDILFMVTPSDPGAFSKSSSVLGSFNMRSGEYVSYSTPPSKFFSRLDDLYLLYWPTTYPVKGLFENQPSVARLG